jgi:hypothetical protein
MKLLQKIKNNKVSVTLLLAATLFVSCSDYLDVDKDTDSPTIAPLNLLLTNIEVTVGSVNDFNAFSGEILSVYTHQATAREEQDQYGAKVSNANVVNDWNNIYLGLTDIETLISQSTATGNSVYLGIAQMQKAYLMSIAVDLWGDVPYSEATKLTSGIISPKFDDQKEIYKAVFELIESAKTNLRKNEGLQKPSKDDLFYGGSTTKWIKFANTFKLKLYNQTRLTADFDQVGFNALLAENNFFTSNDDDFQFESTKNITPSDENNRYFVASYKSTQFGSYQSPWFYEILKGMNPAIHNGNSDPRLPYYFYNQLRPNQLPPDQGNATTGDPRADYWDKSTGFYSIRFGSTGPNRDSSAENSYTYPGIFVTGGRYDNGQGGSVAVLGDISGTGIAPHRILTYDEFLYIQAELTQVGKITTGTAAAKLMQAMTASFAKVDQVVSKNGSSQTIPVLSGSTRVATFIANVMTEYAAASNTKKLEIIMTQKWVGTFGDPMDQYNDYRRTGFPILADPKSTTPEYQLNNGDAYPLIDSQTVLNNEYQLSLFWPQSELNVNQNAPAQKNPTTYKIFWDN